MGTRDSGEVIPYSEKTGEVVLRGVTVDLDTDIGQIFVADCCRNVEGQMSDAEIKTKYELTDADWRRLADNSPLLRAVRAELSAAF